MSNQARRGVGGKQIGLVQQQDLQAHKLSRWKRQCLDMGAASLDDEGLLELLIGDYVIETGYQSLPKNLLDRFGNLASLISAPVHQLLEAKGIDENLVVRFKVAKETATRLARKQVSGQDILSNQTQLEEYCRCLMASISNEQLRVLFLDAKNRLIKDELIAQGTVDHVSVYPREILIRAIRCGAVGIVLVHNHPSGDPTPSPADINMTVEIQFAGAIMGVLVMDHLIVGRSGNYSMREKGMLK